MSEVLAFAAASKSSPLARTTIARRAPRPDDVVIDILFCGVCHSDLHQVRDEWGGSVFPMVPGHEIVGRVTAVGKDVQKFAVGDLAAIGCFVDSCGTCAPCKAGHEQFCEKGAAYTYNATEMDRSTRTHGGYSKSIVARERYVLKMPAGMDPARSAPLLCAGITTYSPLRQHRVKAGDRVAIVGLGGLGHMGVKLAASMGAEVTVLSTSPSKEKDAKKLGAHAFAATRDPSTFDKLKGSFDFILDTVSANHDVGAYLGLVKPYGTMVIVGVPPEPMTFGAGALIMKNRKLAGSLIGGIAETQEMLDYCASREITAEVEVIPIQKIDEAYERMVKNDVHYRFVIDLASLT